jgi:hypothetical protein
VVEEEEEDIEVRKESTEKKITQKNLSKNKSYLSCGGKFCEGVLKTNLQIREGHYQNRRFIRRGQEELRPFTHIKAIQGIDHVPDIDHLASSFVYLLEQVISEQL